MVVKTRQQYLAAMPHWIMIKGVKSTEPTSHIEDAIDWLVDYGPAFNDWNIFEDIVEIASYSRHRTETTKDVLFCFRHARDAMLFKLKWA